MVELGLTWNRRNVTQVGAHRVVLGCDTPSSSMCSFTLFILVEEDKGSYHLWSTFLHQTLYEGLSSNLWNAGCGGGWRGAWASAPSLTV